MLRRMDEGINACNVGCRKVTYKIRGWLDLFEKKSKTGFLIFSVFALKYHLVTARVCFAGSVYYSLWLTSTPSFQR